MADQRKAGRFGKQVPCDGGQRPGRFRNGRHGGGNAVAEPAARDRSGVRRHDDGVRLDAFAAGEDNAGRLSGLDQHLSRVFGVAELGSGSRGDVRKCRGQPMHAALDEPDAHALHMSDEHQRRRRRVGRRAAVGGVTSKQLTQTRIVEVRSKCPPQSGERADLPQVSEIGPADQGPHAWPNGANEGLIKRCEHAMRPRAELSIPCGLGGPGEGGNGVDRAVLVREEVDHAAVGPGVTCQHIDLLQSDMVGERKTGVGEDVLEDPAHGEYGRSGIELPAPDIHLAHLAARRAHPFDDDHVPSARRQQERGHQAADPGSDDDDATAPNHDRWVVPIVR